MISYSFSASKIWEKKMNFNKKLFYGLYILSNFTISFLLIITVVTAPNFSQNIDSTLTNFSLLYPLFTTQISSSLASALTILLKLCMLKAKTLVNRHFIS